MALRDSDGLLMRDAAGKMVRGFAPYTGYAACQMTCSIYGIVDYVDGDLPLGDLAYLKDIALSYRLWDQGLFMAYCHLYFPYYTKAMRYFIWTGYKWYTVDTIADVYRCDGKDIYNQPLKITSQREDANHGEPLGVKFGDDTGIFVLEMCARGNDAATRQVGAWSKLIACDDPAGVYEWAPNYAPAGRTLDMDIGISSLLVENVGQYHRTHYGEHLYPGEEYAP